jgi:hypothetical protein
MLTVLQACSFPLDAIITYTSNEKLITGYDYEC